MAGHPREMPKYPVEESSVTGHTSFPSHTDCFARRPTVREELGHLIPMETLAWEESQDQGLTWLLQLPSPGSLTARTR